MTPDLKLFFSKPVVKKSMFALLAALGIYILMVVLVYAFQDRLQYYPDPRAYTLKEVGAKDYVDFPVTAPDGLPLKGWYAPRQGKKPVLVVFHGNASTYHWRAADFEKINAYGYGVLLVGYRGYGGNPGKPSEKDFYDDGQAYLQALKKSESLYDRDLVLYGESLGTGVAIEMARRFPKIRAIILENPYTSMVALARHHYPFMPFANRFVKNRYDNIAKITELGRIPKLFLIAGADTIVPPAFGEALFQAAALPKKLKTYENAGHIDIRQQGGLEDTRAFLGQFEN